MTARACVPAVGILASALAIGGFARAAAQEASDDLTVVKRAVAQAPAPSPPAAAAKASPAPRTGQPRWLKVRIFDKGTKKGRVSVNLPLAVVRALGDAPLDWRCGGDDHKDRRCSIKMSEVLEALEAGQELVEVDDDDKIVKVWVE
jgi:hypothetical protein